MTDQEKTEYEEFSVKGNDLLSKVKEIIHEGNVRRVYIKNSDGKTLLEIPLSAGIGITAVAALVAPALIAVGAIAAVVTDARVGVDRATS